MKSKFALAIISAFMLLATTSCKKDDTVQPYTCATCARTPDALAANDNSSKGIYKGVLIASTGTIKFDIANNGTAITAVMVIDNITVNLTSSITWQSGAPYVAPFTGTLNGSPVSIVFSVEDDGSDVAILSASIPGHPNATFAIVKETSTMLIEGFVGTYSTTEPESGTFNILVARSASLWGGIARENGTTDTEDIGGAIIGNNLYEDATNVATLSGDNLSGTHVNGSGHTVTVTGRRTL